MQYVMIAGEGNPDCARFKRAVRWLFTAVHALKLIATERMGKDFVEAPLEGLWWAEDMSDFIAGNKQGCAGEDADGVAPARAVTRSDRELRIPGLAWLGWWPERARRVMDALPSHSGRAGRFTAPGPVDSPDHGRRAGWRGFHRVRAGRFPGPRPPGRLAGIPPRQGRSIPRTADAGPAGGDSTAPGPVDSPNRGRRTRWR
jgi:hypothetical protein